MSRAVCQCGDARCGVSVDRGGFGPRGRRRFRREHGDVRRQQLESFRNPEELPAHLQGALLVPGKRHGRISLGLRLKIIV